MNQIKKIRIFIYSLYDKTPSNIKCLAQILIFKLYMDDILTNEVYTKKYIHVPFVSIDENNKFEIHGLYDKKYIEVDLELINIESNFEDKFFFNGDHFIPQELLNSFMKKQQKYNTSPLLLDFILNRNSKKNDKIKFGYYNGVIC